MMSEGKRKTINVPSGIKPIRLDKFLASLDELDISRSFIQQMISDNLVVVDGKTVGKSFRLKGGETIDLIIPPPEKFDLTPEDIPLSIIYEDEHLAVVDKPAGLVVHPAPGNPKHTVVNALLYHFGNISEDDKDLRPGIIHRLDKGTSGLLLAAKNDTVARKLRRQLADRQITKIYQAVVCGHMPDRSGTINLPIGRSIKDRKKMTVTDIASREAITHYRVLESFRLVDLVEVEIKTGRTHQIRVHLSHLNRPVFGDPDYGGRSKWLSGIGPSARKSGKTLLEIVERQMLHAKTLAFTHPVTGKEMEITGDLPDDIEGLLSILRDKYR
jgi:23S rRNA pseudouridine1911/1915/1917 synthase